MKRTITTHDGKTVKVGTEIWFCTKNGKAAVFSDIKDRPTLKKAKGEEETSLFFNYFSTKEACQDYINNLNRISKCKPQKNS